MSDTGDIDLTVLRKLAERELARRTADAQVAPVDPVRLSHELQVHQIELELHNEELQRAYEESDALRRHCADIYDFAPVAYFTLNSQGDIAHMNLAGAILLGIKRSEHARRRFAAFVDAASLAEFNRFFSEVMSARSSARCVVRLLPMKGAEPAIVRIEGVADESGDECRVVVIDMTTACTATEMAFKHCPAIRKADGLAHAQPG